MFSRCAFVLVALAVLAASPATAQTPTPDPARRYPLPTYDENWQLLSDPNRHTDPWDIVKYLQLADGMFVSFAGEAARRSSSGPDAGIHYAKVRTFP